MFLLRTQDLVELFEWLHWVSLENQFSAHFLFNFIGSYFFKLVIKLLQIRSMIELLLLLTFLLLILLALQLLGLSFWGYSFLIVFNFFFVLFLLNSNLWLVLNSLSLWVIQDNFLKDAQQQKNWRHLRNHFHYYRFIIYIFVFYCQKNGAFRELNPGPLHP